MSRRIIDEFVIPRGTGKAFIVKKGQVLRVIEHEGPQVSDLIFFNAHNHHEQFSSRRSALYNSLLNMGGLKRLSKLYSKAPWERVMITVVDDPVGVHVPGSHCSKKVWELKPDLRPLWGRTCTDIFETCLAEFGIILADKESCGVLNVFQNFECDEDGSNYRSIGSVAKKGDYIDLLAEMDILVGYSNCGDQNVINNFEAKNMKVQILE